MRLRNLGLVLGLGLAVSAARLHEASACGGYFGPPMIEQSGAAAVTGHRMALATSPTRTVLWDQIQYSGDPKEFAWVLPVGPGAVLEESKDAWFETLDGATTAQISSPVYTCPSLTTPRGCGRSETGDGEGGSGGGSGSYGGDGDGSAALPPPVTIVHQGTVGPYETVTLHSDDGSALTDWLTGHGYHIDADIEPIIEAYVSEGFDFVALRLLPDKGVNAMKPVRVVTPGASTTLPLRMVAAGTGVNVAITLFTITEGRLAPSGYRNEIIRGSDLTWDFAAQTSSYDKVRQGILAENEGFTWITSYAQQGVLLSPTSDPDYGEELAYGYSEDLCTEEAGEPYCYVEFDTLAQAYVGQGIADGDGTPSDYQCYATRSDAGTIDAVVTDPCPPGVAFDDPSCTGAIGASQLDARSLACGKLDDLVAAMTGPHPRSVWLTRLEANLPRHALAHDLTLQPSVDQSAVSNYLTATRFKNAGGLCPDDVPPLSLAPLGGGTPGARKNPAPFIGLGFVALALASILGRRLSRPAPVRVRVRGRRS